MNLVSPISGYPLTPDTPHSLSDGAGERWPVLDGIPYLRVGRGSLVAAVLDHLDAGRGEDALVALLADQDDWWTGPATDDGELRRLVRERDTLTLRDAMALLRFGPVADYFAYRWSDPTYLAGLALLEAHWNEPKTAFELACGIGHYLRELTRRGVACVGADVVFAKCWLAKHRVAPDAEYVVFDAGFGWPTGEARYDLVMCHDAFYFLPEQGAVAGRLRALVAQGGVLAISHLHNVRYFLGAKGPARPLAEWRALFPNAIWYAETELLIAGMERRRQEPIGWFDAAGPGDDGGIGDGVEAVSLIEGGGLGRTIDGGLFMPVANTTLVPNPLLDGATVRWPSERYREEYEGACLWALPDRELGTMRDPVRLRRLVDLPERW